MRAIFNILIIFFVAGSVYSLYTNNDLREKVHSFNFEAYVEKFEAQIKKFSGSLDSFGSAFDDSGTLEMAESGPGSANYATSAPVFEPVLPIPLKKILTEVGLRDYNASRTHANLTVTGIVSETNKERTAHQKLIFSESAKLDASAQAKADDILKRQYFAHVAPDGTDVGDLATDAGYQYLKIGENLALGDFESNVEVVAAWMNSSGHRANILDGQYTEIGVGIAFGVYEDHYMYVVVQHFGRPLGACPSVSTELKVEVEKGQAGLEMQAEVLTEIRTRIDQGRAEGKDMNDDIDLYNTKLEAYNVDYARVNELRVKYNTQVNAYNSCLTD